MNKDKHYDLVVCIRCHKEPAFICDTYDSVVKNTNPERTKVICAVDNNIKLTEQLKQSLGEDVIYNSPHPNGWGAGLFTLYLEAIEWAESKWSFSHFCSIDYDTLFLDKGADDALLSRVTDETIGLVGDYVVSHQHWATVFRKEKEKFEKVFGPVPKKYVEGEGVQGGCLMITRRGIDLFKEKGIFNPPYRNAKDNTNIADDHLLPIFIRMCGLGIMTAVPFTDCKWVATRDPKGLEKKGVKIFHPTKMRPKSKNRQREIDIRNYFRKIRCVPLLGKV